MVGKFVEFFGPGLDELGAAGPRHDRQHGAGIWRDLRLLPGRQGGARTICACPAATTHRIALVEAYLKAQGMFREPGAPDPVFTDTLELDLSHGAAVAWPARSGRRIACC